MYTVETHNTELNRAVSGTLVHAMGGIGQLFDAKDWVDTMTMVEPRCDRASRMGLGFLCPFTDRQGADPKSQAPK